MEASVARVRALMTQATKLSEIVALEGAVEPGEAVAVTVEDAGGVEAPTTTPIVASQPA